MENAEVVVLAPVPVRHRAQKVETPVPAEPKREKNTPEVEEGFQDVVHNWPCTD